MNIQPHSNTQMRWNTQNTFTDAFTRWEERIHRDVAPSFSLVKPDPENDGLPISPRFFLKKISQMSASQISVRLEPPCQKVASRSSHHFLSTMCRQRILVCFHLEILISLKRVMKNFLTLTSLYLKTYSEKANHSHVYILRTWIRVKLL